MINLRRVATTYRNQFNFRWQRILLTIQVTKLHIYVYILLTTNSLNYRTRCSIQYTAGIIQKLVLRSKHVRK